MTIQVQEVDLCKLNVHYVAEPEKVRAARLRVVDRIKKEKVPVKGFRPGAAPTQAIELQMKSTIDSLAAKDLVSEAYNDLLFEHKIKTMFYPQVTSQSFDKDQFYCEMMVWKKPDVELKEYKGFSIPKPASEPVTELVAKMIQNLRVKHGESRPYGEGDFVQQGDKITLDIKVESEGQVVSELTQEGLVYNVGQFSKLDENLLGMVPDETKNFKVSMDEDTPLESLKNKVVDFTVTLHMGMRTDLAALDDAFAQKVGFPTYEKLESYASSVVMSQSQQKERNDLTNQVLVRLLEHNEINVPGWLVEMEAQNVARNRGMDLKTMPPETKSRLFTEAERAVKLSLILDSIREAEPDTSFSERELLNSLRMKVSGTGGNPDDFIKKSTEDGSIFGIVANMRDSATVEWVIKNSTIIE
jgi:trigger factor